jgi:hypothetical protein
MTDPERSQSDIEVLGLYETIFDESEIVLKILDLIDNYRNEIIDYVINGSLQELVDYRIELEASSAILTAEFTRLIGQVIETDEISETISLLTTLFKRINRAYLTSLSIGGCLCSTCADHFIDTDIVQQQIDGALSNAATHDYNPEKTIVSFKDGMRAMNAHLLEHFERN